MCGYTIKDGTRSDSEDLLRRTVGLPTIDLPVTKQAADPSGSEGAAVSVQSQQGRWSVEIYQVCDHDHQQLILEAFLEIARSDVVALGTQNGDHWFVVAEVSSVADKNYVRRTVKAIDEFATRTYSSTPPQFSGPLSG
jgi:hypothetical protein